METLTNGSSWSSRERANCRRPIPGAEVPQLEALGARVRQLREAAGLSRRKLADQAAVDKSTIERIEKGIRRTRRSTLERIVAGLVAEVEQPVVLEELVALAGPALAPESAYRDRVDRRRAGRQSKGERARLRAERARGQRKFQREMGEVGELRQITDLMNRLDRLQWGQRRGGRAC